MTDAEKQALATVALCAACADGPKEELERAALRDLADSLGGAFRIDARHRDAQTAGARLAEVAAALRTPTLRQLAFELALGVCNADGLRTAQETRFLAQLGAALSLSAPAMTAAAVAADALATMPLGAPAQERDAQCAALRPEEAALEQMILTRATLAAALALLPQPIATLAIIPVQIKLVHRIASAYGGARERSDIEAFFAAVGVARVGQYLEHIARKIVRGDFGDAADGVRGAPHAALAFATTDALGHLAMRYYASGRTIDARTLNAGFAAQRAQAQTLSPQQQVQIEQQARAIDPAQIVPLVRGQ